LVPTDRHRLGFTPSNININNINVVLINATVSDRQGKKCLTLADIVKAQGLSKVDFINMNIGGREEAVLGASGDFFRKFKPKIIIESHVVSGVLSVNAIVHFLRKYDYDCSIELPVPENTISFLDGSGRYQEQVHKTPPWIFGVPKNRVVPWPG
jgi:hypothetical protein